MDGWPGAAVFRSALLAALERGGLSRPVRVLDACGSTNDELRAWADADGSERAPDGALVLAGEQRQGRGRRGRAWISGRGLGLYASLLVRRPAVMRLGGRLPLLVGLALTECARELGAREAAVKWPNDVLCRGRKLAGVLCESDGRAVVLGFGLNVGQRTLDFPPELRSIATSLELEGAAGLELASVCCAAVDHLERHFVAIEAGAPFPRERWEERSCTLGRLVDVREGVDAVRGQAVGLAPDGALVVRTDDGERSVYAGDVVPVG